MGKRVYTLLEVGQQTSEAPSKDGYQTTLFASHQPANP
jgi:hypothetical protein